jgi:hypothetical protein
MKKIMISVAIFIATNGFAQMIETKKLATGTGGWEITMDVEKNIDNNNSIDTTIFFYYQYQNKASKNISDKGSIYIQRKKQLIDFADALKTLASKGSGVSLEFQVWDYKLNLYDFSNEIYISNKNGKYTTLKKEIAVKMAYELIENAKFLIK